MRESKIVQLENDLADAQDANARQLAESATKFEECVSRLFVPP